LGGWNFGYVRGTRKEKEEGEMRQEEEGEKLTKS